MGLLRKKQNWFDDSMIAYMGIPRLLEILLWTRLLSEKTNNIQKQKSYKKHLQKRSIFIIAKKLTYRNKSLTKNMQEENEFLKDSSHKWKNTTDLWDSIS